MESDNQSRAGLVLSLFRRGQTDGGRGRNGKGGSANPGNVVLLAGAAYWYAAQNDGAKALELGQKAVAAEPRYIVRRTSLLPAA